MFSRNFHGLLEISEVDCWIAPPKHCCDIRYVGAPVSPTTPHAHAPIPPSDTMQAIASPAAVARAAPAPARAAAARRSPMCAPPNPSGVASYPQLKTTTLESQPGSAATIPARVAVPAASRTNDPRASRIQPGFSLHSPTLSRTPIHGRGQVAHPHDNLEVLVPQLSVAVDATLIRTIPARLALRAVSSDTPLAPRVTSPPEDRALQRYLGLTPSRVFSPPLQRPSRRAPHRCARDGSAASRQRRAGLQRRGRAWRALLAAASSNALSTLVYRVIWHTHLGRW